MAGVGREDDTNDINIVLTHEILKSNVKQNNSIKSVLHRRKAITGPAPAPWTCMSCLLPSVLHFTLILAGLWFIHSDLKDLWSLANALLPQSCGDLNENGPHGLICLNAWSWIVELFGKNQV